MLAVDTNILVRYLTRDDAGQFARAAALMRGNDVFVATTVLLETEWVLRRSYQYSSAEIVEALRSIAGLSRVTLEEPVLALQAFDWLERGMDFADALHLANTGGCEAFISFDRRLASVASRVGARPVRAP